MQLHAHLHRQIHGNIFIRVIYSKQQVQLETEKVYPPHSYVTNRTENGIIENLEKRGKCFASTITANQCLRDIKVFGSTYSLTPVGSPTVFKSVHRTPSKHKGK